MTDRPEINLFRQQSHFRNSFQEVIFGSRTSKSLRGGKSVFRLF